MKRGDIYYIESYYQEVGSEQKAGRPAVIVSNNNNNNNNSEVVEVCYLTTKPKNDLPTHVITRGTGIVSTILCEQIDSVSTVRVGAYCGEVSEEEQRQIDIALAISVGIQPEPITVVQDARRDEVGELVADVYIAKLETEHALYKKLFEDMWNAFVVNPVSRCKEEER